MKIYWVQIATIATTLTVGSLAAAQDDLAPRAVVMPPDPPRDQPREAPATREPAVGGEGRWVFDLLGGQLGGPSNTVGGIGFIGPFQITNVSQETEMQGLRSSYKITVIALTPSFDTFVTERFSIGGAVSAGILSGSTVQQQAPAMPGTAAPPDYTASQRGYTLGIAPRIGYAIPISSSIAFWPRIGAGYEVSRQAGDDAETRTVMKTYSVESNLGVGFRISKHALFDVGPVFTYRHLASDPPTGTATVFASSAPGTSEQFGASVRGSLRLDF